MIRCNNCTINQIKTKHRVYDKDTNVTEWTKFTKFLSNDPLAVASNPWASTVTAGAISLDRPQSPHTEVFEVLHRFCFEGPFRPAATITIDPVARVDPL